jgi:hypothetical protein
MPLEYSRDDEERYHRVTKGRSNMSRNQGMVVLAICVGAYFLFKPDPTTDADLDPVGPDMNFAGEDAIPIILNGQSLNANGIHLTLKQDEITEVKIYENDSVGQAGQARSVVSFKTGQDIEVKVRITYTAKLHRTPSGFGIWAYSLDSMKSLSIRQAQPN